jgi:hypothetical protein
VQGYTYAAYRARARLAAAAGDTAGAGHWDAKAGRIKEAFNDAHWLADRGWFAVALDRAKRPVDSLTSNIGHCLWTGIAGPGKAALVAEYLLAEDMFSGWGIRTLAASMTAYNPMSYHNGSVWPHDNALCAAGLIRYGFTGHAQRIAEAIFDAAGHSATGCPNCSAASHGPTTPPRCPTHLLLAAGMGRGHPAAVAAHPAAAHPRTPRRPDLVRASDPGTLPVAAPEQPAARELTPGHRRPGRPVGTHRPGRHGNRTHPGPMASARRALRVRWRPAQPHPRSHWRRCRGPYPPGHELPENRAERLYPGRC